MTAPLRQLRKGKMVYNPEKHHRRSIRLRGYDYAQPGAYFVTVCVRERECVLGNITDGEMVLSDLGKIARDFWAQVPVHFPTISIDTFVVMPNHVHAVIIINDLPCRGAVTAPLQTGQSKIDRPTLSQIIAYYKYQTTKHINQIHDNAETPFWQRGFYDHIIRNKRELNAIQQYIADNPVKWQLDRDNPQNL
jgi:REP element-mobilizing transposase RayT